MLNQSARYGFFFGLLCFHLYYLFYEPEVMFPIGIHIDKSAGSMWGIDNSIVVLISSIRLLKSINSILEKYVGSGLNSISRIILRSDSCLARRPVGRISSSLMGFRGLLYGIGLCGIVFFAVSEMLKTI